MLLPGWKQIISTDFAKQYQSLVAQLSLSLNNGVSVLYTALNNNLTFEDNSLGTTADVTLTVDANGKPTQTAAFKLNTTANVNFVTVGFATNNTNSSTYPAGGIFVSGVQASNIYTINNVTGLTPGQSWTIRIRAEQQN